MQPSHRQFDEETLRFRPQLVSYASKYPVSGLEHQDLVQMAYLRAWGAYPTFRKRGNERSARSWLFQILRHVIVDERRRATTSISLAPGAEIVGPATADPATLLTQSGNLCLDAGIVQLCDRHQRYLQVWFQYGSHRETAYQLGITEGASRELYRRIRRRLIRLLNTPREPGRFHLAPERITAIAKQASVPVRVVVSLCCEQDWSDPDHQEWLNSASISEIADWVLANLEP